MPPQIDKQIALEENMMNDSSLPADPNENISHTQKYLLLLLFIQWFVLVIILGVGIYSIFIGNAVDTLSGIESLIPIIVLVIYYTFGLLVTYKKHRIGLLIFASIGVILFVGVFIFVGYIILAITALSVGFGGSTPTYELIVFFGILFTVVAIVAIMSLKFSFDLAKSIQRNEYSTV